MGKDVEYLKSVEENLFFSGGVKEDDSPSLNLCLPPIFDDYVDEEQIECNIYSAIDFNHPPLLENYGERVGFQDQINYLWIDFEEEPVVTNFQKPCYVIDEDYEIVMNFKSNRNDVGVESYGANAELGALVSDFPWECLFVKNVVEVMVEHKPSSKGMNVSLLLLLTDKPKHSDLCTLNAQLLGVNLRPKHAIVAFDPGGIQCKVQNKIHPKTSRARMGLVCYKVDGSLTGVDVVLMIPRYFMMVFDPGGVDVSPPIEVAFEHVSLNLLNSFNQVLNNGIRIFLLSIRSWCRLWTLIIGKIEAKFLLNPGSLQQELRYGYIIFQSNHGKNAHNDPRRKPLRKAHQNRTFYFDFRIMVILFAPYLEFYLVKFCDLCMVQFLKKSSFIWFWNQQVSLSIFVKIKLQRLSRLMSQFLKLRYVCGKTCTTFDSGHILD